MRPTPHPPSDGFPSAAPGVLHPALLDVITAGPKVPVRAQRVSGFRTNGTTAGRWSAGGCGRSPHSPEVQLMTTSPTPLPPWPAPPSSDGDAHARLTWYAAVARWAPSKHNSQPWRFVVAGDRLEIWRDPSRLLAATDPHSRELVMSCAAAAHLACVAARSLGVEPVLSVFPAAEGSCVASLREGGAWPVSAEDRALLAVVPHRRTDRGPLDGDQLPAELPFVLQDVATAENATLHLVRSVGARATLATLVATADRLLHQRGVTDAELARWLRDAGDLRTDGVPATHTRGQTASYAAEFVQRDFSTSRSRPAQDRPGPDHPLVAVLCTPHDRREDWVVAGRALAAVLLRAALAGAHASYLNQPVEEPRMRAMLRDDLALAGVPQLVLRLGVGGHVDAPPRRPLDDVALVGLRDHADG